MRLPGALVALALAFLLGAAVPSAAPAARGKAACSKKRACRSAVGRTPRAGMPAAWAKGLVLPLPPAPGGGGTPPPPDTTAPPPPPPPPPPPSSPRFLQVTADDEDLDDMHFYLSRASVLAGQVQIEFNNKYTQDPHNLRLRRTGVTPFGFPELDNGEVAQMEFNLSVGAYTLYCSLAGHEAKGMKATLTVESG